MSWYNKLERQLAPFAISNLTTYLVIGQTFVYLSALLGLLDLEKFILVPGLVTHGEPWRLVTFIFFPPASYWALFAFAMYFFWLMGSSLESHWGTVRYNLFLLTGYFLTVGVSFFTPYSAVTNLFIGGSILLAFAYLNPEFVIYVFMVLPLKIKWLAWFTAALYVWQMYSGPLAVKLSVVAGLGNFLLFFGRDMLQSLSSNRRRMGTQARRFAQERSPEEPRHRCHVCGKTDLTDPQLDFRYCSKCVGDQCYCPDHIFNHKHVTADAEADAKS